MLFSSNLASKMKDKYVERKDTFLHPFHTNPNANPHSSPGLGAGHSPVFQQQKRECLSDEAEVDSVKKPRNLKDENKQLIAMPQGGDGATIEVVKRPRGRPPGSKNKPKPPVVITRDAEPAAAMRPHVLEIPGGHDIVDSLVRFSRRRNLGVCVLAGTGAVSNVTLHQPAAVPTSGGGSIVFHGRFEILSISATFLPPAMSALSPPAAANGGMSISLAGPHGQIVGGTVAGPLITAGTVIMVVAAFNNPTFHRLPAEDDMSVSVSVSGGGEEVERDHHEREREHHVQHRQYQVEEPQREHEHAAAHVPGQNQAESCGMSMYSCHLPSDVIWAPTPRPPHPPPY
ncbi:AT-hook motif nuclear-localized protein 17 [Rhynchospora pubera]|uniref:AT-hook motif nuclear-localized protein 17 n=1 Tax=Rhynchospora pubera TaxID=906938 RepID=A0AAV8HFB2_9POAL|nr:AT-hook motif nuclear-localized protein 17 [Rhynchospora pubera]